jgi:hypothetical protein
MRRACSSPRGLGGPPVPPELIPLESTRTLVHEPRRRVGSVKGHRKSPRQHAKDDPRSSTSRARSVMVMNGIVRGNGYQEELPLLEGGQVQRSEGPLCGPVTAGFPRTKTRVLQLFRISYDAVGRRSEDPLARRCPVHGPTPWREWGHVVTQCANNPPPADAGGCSLLKTGCRSSSESRKPGVEGSSVCCVPTRPALPLQ